MLLHLAAWRLCHIAVRCTSSKQLRLALQAADRIVVAAEVVAVVSLVPLIALKYVQVWTRRAPSLLAVIAVACLFHLLVLHATICQQQVSQCLLNLLQDDRAALRQPIYQVIQLCCTAFLIQPDAACQCPAVAVTAAVSKSGT